MNDIDIEQRLIILSEHRGLLYFIKEEHYLEFTDRFYELEDIINDIDELILLTSSCLAQESVKIKDQFFSFEEKLQCFTEKFDF